MIEHRHLRYFLALAHYLHYGRAAASVHITQPSLSRQIADLEDKLGCHLVSRTSRNVQLTAAGREFHRTAQAVLAGMDSAIRTTQAVARGERGELKIAFTSMVAWTDFPRMIKRFTTEAPSVSLELSEMLPNDLLRSVTFGACDIGLTFKVAVELPLRYQAMQVEKLCVALHISHPLANEDAIDVERLSDQAFLISPRETAPTLYDSVVSLCHHAGFEPQIRMQAQLQATIVNLVAEGLGVAILPAAMAKTNPDTVRFLPLHSATDLEIGMVWNEENSNPCLTSFVQSLEGRFS